MSTLSTNILVVDDAAVVRKQVRKALERAGYTAIEAVDGAEGLDKVAANPHIRLVVCDVHMPRMNGIEFLEQLRERASPIPVLMLTAEAHPDLVRRAQHLGARGWIMKPLKLESLVAVVKKVVPLEGVVVPGDAG
jgi:two-component system chemotaxis response regulator CheY